MASTAHRVGVVVVGSCLDSVVRLEMGFFTGRSVELDGFTFKAGAELRSLADNCCENSMQLCLPHVGEYGEALLSFANCYLLSLPSPFSNIEFLMPRIMSRAKDAV